MDPQKLTQVPTLRLQRLSTGRQTNDTTLEVFTDGACLENGKENTRCGSGIWVAPDHPMNRMMRCPGPLQLNQVGEITTILVVLQLADPLTPLKIITDSRYTIDRLTTHLRQWEDHSWIGIANSNLLQATAYQLHRRAATTTFKWTKGQSRIEGNKQANRLAGLGATKELPDDVNLKIPDNFTLQGAKLQSMTQALGYAGIREKKHLEYKRSTIQLLDVTRHAIAQITTKTEMDASIWASCRKKDISKKIQSFLFRTLHNAYCISNFWMRIPMYEQRVGKTLNPWTTY
ncbi:ribonuclease H-like domain-containing protein [Suillus tomentosus]|nr:ribonuclease H-like domain-containing protein [Suillus tomentosus]